MLLTPYGNINKRRYPENQDPKEKIEAFRGSASDYEAIYVTWFQQMKENVWPVWDAKHREWSGDAARRAEAGTEAELNICMNRFQKTKVLEDIPAVSPTMPDFMIRDHLWHFDAEDAKVFGNEKRQTYFDRLASNDAGSNYLGYYESVAVEQFELDFWKDGGKRQPNFFPIKLIFQRPRPWTTARAFGIDDFTWYSGSPNEHTGVHPAFPSGHCYQGLIHSGNVLNNWLLREEAGAQAPAAEAIRALKQYAVDWGDRRVFAGVHYPTDNIASWLFALRLVSQMFEHGAEVAEFITDAIVNHSLVYKVIIEDFPSHEALAPALDLLNQNIGPSVAA